MKKSIHFDRFGFLDRWPDPLELEPFFLAPRGKEWSYNGGNDNWGLGVEGLYNTENLDRIDQINVQLYMTGNPDLGVMLVYNRWDGRVRRMQSMNSKGDLARLGEFVESLHGTPLSVGLFIPFRIVWPAVKEFMETDGELPTSIEWVATEDLPPETFPDP